MSNNEEKFILKGILSFNDYAIKYLDKLEPEYFSQEVQPIIKGIKKYYFKYAKIPGVKSLIEIVMPQVLKSTPEKLEACEDIIQAVIGMESNADDFYKWLSDETKTFITAKRIEDALYHSMPLFSSNKIEEAVKLINNAVAINFDDNLGLDYFGDIKERMARLKEGDNVIPTGYEIVDRTLNGGWRNKTLTVFGAGTNVGKTLILSDITSKLLKQSMNGLYITLEIYQDSLANRIDANLADIEMNQLKDNADILEKKLDEERKKAADRGCPFGELIIKEYPPATLSCNQILAYVRELQLKKSFAPAFICLDYLALMAPNGKSFSDNTYGKLKTVAEELRAVACILDIPIFTATQVNRDAYGSSEVGMEKTSDSMGIPMTADIMIMVSRNSDMEAENKMYWHIAKSRFSKNGGGFFMNVEYGNMRLTPSEVNSSDYVTVNHNEKKKEIQGKKKALEVLKSVHDNNGVPSINSKETGNVQESTKTINI